MVQHVLRHIFTIAEAVSALINDDLTDCDRFEIRVDGGMVVVDVVAPAGRAGFENAGKEEETAKEANGDKAVDTDSGTGLAAIDSAPAESKRKGGPLAQRAGILCGEKGFRTFAALKYDAIAGTPDETAAWLRQHCQVRSRADLDHVADGADRFRGLEKAYRLWLEGYD